MGGCLSQLRVLHESGPIAVITPRGKERKARYFRPQMRRTEKQPLPLGQRLHRRQSWVDGFSLRLVSLLLLTGSCCCSVVTECGPPLHLEGTSKAAGLLLSRGRGFMGAAMVDHDPAVVLFAGGIGMEGTVVDSNVDAFALPAARLLLRDQATQQLSDTAATGTDSGNGGVPVARDVLSLGVARTDMGAGATTNALFFAGGCGMDALSLPPPADGHDQQQERQQQHQGGLRDDDGDGDGRKSAAPAVVQDGGEPAAAAAARGRVSDPDGPLLLKNCQATDVVDVFATTTGGGGRSKGRGGGGGEGEEALPLVVAASDGSLRLCEPKYAATIGVFYTGETDVGDPDNWPPTAHVLVAGGIVPTSDPGGGGYTATSTVDILREDGVDNATGQAKITNLPEPRLWLPNPPRFEMTSCCFKHQCVFAGGRISMGEGGVDFNSDRAEVWDGSTWSFATWGEHTLSEPRRLMGSAVIEITLGADKRTVGIFAGGVSNDGDSSMVDMFDFAEHRVLPRMVAPTVRGPTQGVSVSREVAAFFGATGKIDIFDGRTLCWVSYEADGFLPGTSVVGRSAAWFFNRASPGFQPSGGERGAVEEALAFVGGGVGTGAGTGAGGGSVDAKKSVGSAGDVSRDVRELRWRRTDDGKIRICLGGTPLRELQKVCGLPGPDGSIQAFTPHDDGASDESQSDGAAVPSGAPPVGGDADGNSGNGGGSKSSVVVFVMAALAGILVSYMASATLIVRKVEGLWRLPFGGGVYEALCEGVAQCWRGFCRRCCCCCCFSSLSAGESSERSRRFHFAENGTYGYTTAAGEQSRLIVSPEGDPEGPRRMPRKGHGGGPNKTSGRAAKLSARGDRHANNVGSGKSNAPSGGSGRGAGRDDSRSATSAAAAALSAAKKKKGGDGGGVQILSASAVDAAKAAAKLAAEIANDDGEDEDEAR